MSEILYPLVCKIEACKANRDDRQGVHSWWCPENPWDDHQIKEYRKIKPWFSRKQLLAIGQAILEDRKATQEEQPGWEGENA
jgi:hypothetical protein